MGQEEIVSGARVVMQVAYILFVLAFIIWLIRNTVMGKVSASAAKFMESVKPNPGDKLNPDRNQLDLILNTLQYKTEGHCPCTPTPLRSKDTLCPCATYRTGGECKCGLFVKDRNTECKGGNIDVIG